MFKKNEKTEPNLLRTCFSSGDGAIPAHVIFLLSGDLKVRTEAETTIGLFFGVVKQRNREPFYNSLIREPWTTEDLSDPLSLFSMWNVRWNTRDPNNLFFRSNLMDLRRSRPQQNPDSDTTCCAGVCGSSSTCDRLWSHTQEERKSHERLWGSTECLCPRPKRTHSFQFTTLGPGLQITCINNLRFLGPQESPGKKTKIPLNPGPVIG